MDGNTLLLLLLLECCNWALRGLQKELTNQIFLTSATVQKVALVFFNPTTSISAVLETHTALS